MAEAYGWATDFRAGTLTDDEILSRLFHLNQSRAKAQADTSAPRASAKTKAGM